jgi:transposase
VIPIKADQADARIRQGSRGGRPPTFDTVRYRQRNTVERAVNKLRDTRAVATRYDKRDYMYRGTITVAAIRLWIRVPSHTICGTRPSGSSVRQLYVCG